MMSFDFILKYKKDILPEGWHDAYKLTPVVFIGLAGSGKSSIINHLVENKVIPTGYGINSTRRIVMLKHSDEQTDRYYTLSKNIVTDLENKEFFQKRIIKDTRNKNILLTSTNLKDFKDFLFIELPNVNTIDSRYRKQDLVNFIRTIKNGVIVINLFPTNIGTISSNLLIEDLANFINPNVKIIFTINKIDTISEVDSKENIVNTAREYFLSHNFKDPTIYCLDSKVYPSFLKDKIDILDDNNSDYSDFIKDILHSI